MRLTAVSLLVLALAATGCTSSSDLESAVPASSGSAKTSRLAARTAPLVPAVDVGTTAGIPSPPQKPLAWGGPVPQSPAFRNIAPGPSVEAPGNPMVTTVGMPMPAQRPVSALTPVSLPDMRPGLGVSPGGRSRIYSHSFRDAKPINFGKVSPRKMSVHGVDVSRWQGDIDWAKLRTQGANFAYIKATDGGDHLDPMFKTNWRKAKEAGVKRGAYHFFYWCRVASDQAEWFIRNVPKDPDALPPVIDVEYNGESSCKMRLSRAKVLEKMQVFMDMLERHYGKRPVIYTAPDFYKDNLRGEFLNYPFWLRAVAQHPSVVYPDRRWVFWQYSGSGLSQGVEGKIDLNVFRGGEGDWHDWVARN
ncbi:MULTISPECIES: GH25 family lysozyme [Rhizobium]|uniref:glycoside hydrolase family 25 protein n=1 Tax=Rhizobium/Agrobacterium group TaxID=227290 RepID=UPI0007158FB2|nr:MULTISPECIES: GH25 family lysozyme [Rhizobium]KQQ79344.1 glycosyl hydrolase [Rhizobium sp. Leaf321]MBD8653458.1 glycosyl hydrolase [Rhizobium sp. CFBP 13726]